MISGMNHITLAVTDIEKSFYFYQNILGLKPICKWDKGAYFMVGEFWFCLNLDPNRNSTTCYTHYSFSVTQEDFKSWIERLENFNIKIFKENSSPGDSLYFLDPDGHKLELHVSDWKERMRAKKENPGLWKNVEWFL